MEHLSNEILLVLCDFLFNSHYPSLLSFSSTCRFHRLLARDYVFRDICLKAGSHDEVEQKVKICTDMLEAANAFRSVRMLRVGGETPFAKRGRWWWALEPGKSDYEQLESLMKRLKHLADLHVNIMLLKYSALLDLLSKYHPRCRLHLKEVQFWSLHLDASAQNPSEYALATSKQLHSFAARFSDFHSNGKENYTAEAAVQMASGLAPNLKLLSLVQTAAIDSPALRRARQGPRKEWDGFPAPAEKFRRRASPRQLILLEQTVSRRMIASLAAGTDLTLLHELTLGYKMDLVTLRQLVTINLPVLQVLSIGLEGEEYTEYDALTAEWLHGLKPLCSLRIGRWYSGAIFEAIMAQHGPRLRSLTLPGVWTRECSRPTPLEINQIRASCTKLETLDLNVKRTLGDSREVSQYRVLGSIPRLQSLSLTLDGSNRSLTRTDQEVAAGVQILIPHSFDDFDKLPMNYLPMMAVGSTIDIRNGHMREALINCALDETLALQIFNTIATAKSCGGPLLEKLQLWNSHGPRFGANSSSRDQIDVFAEIGRSWQISRSVRDDQVEQLTIEETDLSHDPPHAPARLHPEMERIFRKIWPRRSSTSDEDYGWRKDWYGIPLAEGASSETPV